jgi:meso-butanediol dehydrogenase / (S,S)-butanediol dehydrogenase / diacetyl reductase
MMLKDKVAVITGGTSGIGAATVVGFVREGASVVFTGTNETKAETVLEKLRSVSLPGQAVFFKSDISDQKQVESLSVFVKKRFGHCGVLFNNAGVHHAGALHETTPQQFDRVISVDLRGVYLACYYFIPQMLEAGGGCIINMSSVSGVAADYSMAAYNAAKAGVTNLTRSIAIDYGDKGIRANAVCPGAVRTEMLEYTFRKIPHAEKANRDAYPTHTFAEPDEIAEVVIFLASGRAQFINGANILIDGGITAHTGQPRY